MELEFRRSLVYELRSFFDLTSEVATVPLERKRLQTWSSKATQNKPRTGESQVSGGFLTLRTQAETTGSGQNPPNRSQYVQGLILLSALPQHDDTAPKATLEGGDDNSGKSRKSKTLGWV